MIVVGGTYRFAGEEPFKEYGAWTVAEIDRGLVRAISTGTYNTGRMQAMCDVGDEKFVGDPRYRVVPCDPIIDETEAFFV